MAAKMGAETFARLSLGAGALAAAWWALAPASVAAAPEKESGEKPSRLKSKPTGGDMSFFMGNASDADNAHLGAQGGKPL